MARLYLYVPYSQKDEAKKLGAKWDPFAGSWYVPDGMNPKAFQRWLKVEESRTQFSGEQKRSDNVPGNVYTFLALGIHGWFPGCLINRVKIGFTRKHPEERRQQIISNQSAHNVKIIKCIYVSDMAAVETALHRRFKHRRVRS